MKIVILSRNAALYSTQSLVGAAIRRGHEVRVIDHVYCDLVISNTGNQIYYHGELIDEVDAIIPRIGSTVTKVGAMVIRHFESKGVFSTLSSDNLLRARDKISCAQIMAANYIQIPKTVICNNHVELAEMIGKIDQYPVVLKLASGTHGLGVILADNERTAVSILEAFSKTKQQVLAQEFVAEANGADVRVLIVDGKVEGVMKRQARDGEFRSNLHRGAIASIITLSPDEQLVAVKAARVLGIPVAGVDLLQSGSGPKILEVNPSPGLEGIETTTKKDIADKIIQFVERNVNLRT